MRLWQWVWGWVWLVGLGATETGGKLSWEQWEGGRLGRKGSSPLRGRGCQAWAFLFVFHASLPSSPSNVGLPMEN